MAMKKTGDAEKLDVVYTGREAGVVHEHLVRTGKALSDFDKGEREALETDLADVAEDAAEVAEESAE